MNFDDDSHALAGDDSCGGLRLRVAAPDAHSQGRGADTVADTIAVADTSDTSASSDAPDGSAASDAPDTSATNDTGDAGAAVDAADATTAQDASASADGAGTVDAADTNIADSADSAAAVDTAAAATSCFIGAPPGSTANVLELPKPTIACAEFDKPMFANPGDTYGKPTLTVEIGAVDVKTGVFAPYKDGDFIPNATGGQDGFHVWVGFRVTLPGKTASKVAVNAHGRGLDSCAPVAFGAANNYYASKDPSKADAYRFALGADKNPGFTLVFQNKARKDSIDWCGKWLDIRVHVLDPATKEWGMAGVLVRVWQALPLP